MPIPDYLADLRLTFAMSSRPGHYSCEGDVTHALRAAAAHHEHTGSIVIQREFFSYGDVNMLFLELNGEDID